MRFRSIKALVLLTACGLTAEASRAAVIPVTPETTGAAWDRTLLTATTRGTETSTAFAVGESAVDTADNRGYVPFSLSAQDQADILASGSTATLYVHLGSAIGAANSTFNVSGLTSRGAGGSTAAGIVGTTTDYTAASTPVVTGQSIAIGDYSLDVTAFVKAQAVSNTAIVFRLESGTLTKADGLQNQIQFSSGDSATAAFRPTLTITTTPEPASLTGVGLLSAALLRRRNRFAR